MQFLALRNAVECKDRSVFTSSESQSEPDRREARRHGPKDIKEEKPPLGALEQTDGFVREGGEGCEASAEADDGERADGGRMARPA